MIGRKTDTTQYTFDETVDPMLFVRGSSHDWMGFWKSNETYNNRHKAKCSFCLSIFSGRIASIIEHKTKKCRNRNQWPDDLRKPLKKISIRAPKSPPAAITEPSSPPCKVVTYIQSELNQRFFKALVSASIPLSCVDNPRFCDFFNFVEVTIPNKSQLRQLMKEAIDDVDRAQGETISAATFINVVMDDWIDDTSGKYYTAINFVINGRIEYAGNLSMDINNTTEAISQLENFFYSKLTWQSAAVVAGEEPNINKVVAITSKSVKVLKLAKTMVRRSMPSIATVPCVHNILNQIMRNVIISAELKDFFETILTVASYFRESHDWIKQLEEWGKQNQQTGVIKSYSETRCISCLEMCESIASKESWFTETFGLTKEGLINTSKLPHEVSLFVRDPNNFTNLNLMVEMLQVIDKTTKSLVGGDSTVCKVWPAIIDMYKYFQSNVSRINLLVPGLAERIITTIDEQCEPLQEAIFVIAFFLSPNHRLLAISGQYTEDVVLRMLGRYAMDNTFSLDECKQVVREAKMYIKGEVPFDGKNSDPKEFWDNVSDTIQLRRLAIRIISIVPHSGSFGRIKYIKSKWHNRMSEETRTSLVRIKMHMGDGEEDAFNGDEVFESDASNDEFEEEFGMDIDKDDFIDRQPDIKMEDNEDDGQNNVWDITRKMPLSNLFDLSQGVFVPYIAPASIKSEKTSGFTLDDIFK